MEIQNTTLDDLAGVIGFSATLALAAWFGDGNNLYIPETVDEGQLLVKLVGLKNAQRLSTEWGREHVAVPSLRNYGDMVKRRQIGRMFERGFGCREISTQFGMTERRVQQICRELEGLGLLEKMPRKNPPEKQGVNLLPNIGTAVAKKPLRSKTTLPRVSGQNTTAAGTGAHQAVIRHKLRG